ncbi:hypothetical protein OSG_eHP14_00175 [environmental Halophage eHP-14]|nr:hypothetical protein OSG_eHP14_00175 [environmental Halophage eHP-14]
MNTDTKLEAKTKEVWAGVRDVGSRRSEIQGPLNELRSKLSGIDDYQDFLDQASVDSFDSYESELKTRAEDRLTEDGEIETARDIVENESGFSSFSDFTGDSTNDTGVFAQADFDEYRTYLTNNSISGFDADTHTRVIKELFRAADQFFKKVTDDFASFDDLENYLTSIGFSSDEAEDLRNELEDEFGSFSDLQSYIDGLDESRGLDGLSDRFEHRDKAIPGVEYDAAAGILYLQPENEVRIERANSNSFDEPEVADVTWKNCSVSDSNPSVGESITITVDAENTGGRGDATALLLVEGDTTPQSKTITIESNTTRTVSFTESFDSVGEFDVSVNSSNVVTVTVGSNNSY